MKIRFAAFALIAVVFLLAATQATAQFNRFRLVAVSDFKWDGPFWQKELPVYLADALVSQMRLDRNYTIWDREETTKVLKEAGRDNAYDASPEFIRQVFFSKRVNFVIAGRLNSVVQTTDVDGSAQVHVSIDLQYFDVETPFLITTERLEFDTHLDKAIAENAAFDKGIARDIFRSATLRMQRSSIRVLGRGEETDF